MEAQKELVITRVYNAPRELIYKAWSEAERLAQWWGPKGCSIQVKKLDFRPGGIFHYGIGMPDGSEMCGIFAYREMVEPERIVFVNSFSDQDGNIIRSPFHAAWPLEILNRLTLEEDNGKTTLTLRGGPINATDEEYKIFEENTASMQQGFKGTLDQLEEYLANA
jgi:uncharacterized protein YndB with AHSA1/START domain